MITFDVAVTAETTDQAKGGGSFKIAVMDAGVSAGGAASAGSRNVAEVPVRLPVSKSS